MTGQIPMTAWEQAVVVSLFVVAFLAFLALLLRWFASQQDAWQKFIQRRDQDWQAFLEQQRCADREEIGSVTQAIRDLLSEFREHDEKQDQHIADVRARKR